MKRDQVSGFRSKVEGSRLEGWKVERLGDVCEVFADGDWIESKDQSPKGIRLIQTGNVGNGVFKDRGEKARYISVETFKRLRCTEIFEGDCLISRLPDPVGRTCILPDTGERMITAVDCTIVRFDKNKIIPEFFNYYSQSVQYLNDIDHETTGTTRKRISRSKLAEVEIPLPPLPEQKRIVSLLDETFAALAQVGANAARTLVNAREVFEAELNVIFGNGRDWEEKRLFEIGETQTGTTPKTSEKKNYGDFIPFIKPADIDINGDGEIRYDNEGLSKTGLQKGRLMPENSVLMVCIGASIGKVGFADRNVSCNQQINTLTAGKGYSTKFFYYAMRSKNFYNSVIKNSAQATLPIINKSKWENLTVRFPKSLGEQRAIVQRLEGLAKESRRLEEVYRQKIEDVEELRKSVLREAFEGEL